MERVILPVRLVLKVINHAQTGQRYISINHIVSDDQDQIVKNAFADIDRLHALVEKNLSPAPSEGRPGLPGGPQWGIVRSMQQSQLDQLEAAPAFGSASKCMCKICGGRALVFAGVDFYRICSVSNPHIYGFSGVNVPYYRCEVCEFLFTDFCDGWDNDDFARWIYNADYIKADPDYAALRPIRTADEIAPLLTNFRDARILDYGSGSGLFAQEMSRRGFAHVESYDPFAHPHRPEGQFDIVTCFEVVEHTAKPLETFADLFNFVRPGGALLLSQCLQPDDIDHIRGAWWYLAPRNGHISTYSTRTLARLSGRFGRVTSARGGLFLMTNEEAELSALREQFSPLPAQLRLTAGSGSDWHDSEVGISGRFRWTRRQTVTWAAQFLRGGENEISIPFVNEIAPGFAQQCRLLIGDTEHPVSTGGGEIKALVAVPDSTTTDIALIQPKLITPSSRGVPDDRHLGVAIVDID